MTFDAPHQIAPRLKRLHEALETGTLRRVTREVNALRPAEIADLLNEHFVPVKVDR